MNRSRRSAGIAARPTGRLAGLPAIVLAFVGLLAFAAPVSAHEIQSIDVDCDAGGITVTGILFGEDLPRLVTVSGPEGYVETFNVTTDTWTHVFPLGANGTYSIDWPDAGDFATTFEVDCEEAVAAPTPPAEATDNGRDLGVGGVVAVSLTPPPTDTEATPQPASSNGGWPLVLLVVATVIALALLVTPVAATRRRS